MTSISFISIDIPPTLLDNDIGNEDKLKSVRAQDKASKSEESLVDEDSGRESQLSLMSTDEDILASFTSDEDKSYSLLTVNPVKVCTEYIVYSDILL